MRTPPDSVMKEIRSYDNRLDLKWNGRLKSWQLFWSSRPVMILRHYDGTPMRTLDGYTDSVMTCIKKADNWNSGDRRLRKMRESDERLADIDAKRSQNVRDEATAESHDRARVFVDGPKPFVSAT